jgi:hypothetical protein
MPLLAIHTGKVSAFDGIADFRLGIIYSQLIKKRIGLNKRILTILLLLVVYVW